MSGELLLPQLLLRHAELRPDVPALVSGRRDALTYLAWHERSRAAAEGLVRAGVRSGDHVALLGNNAAYGDVGVAYIAVLLAGAVVLPLAGTQPLHELEHAIDRAGVRLVVTCDGAPELSQGPRAIPLRELEVDDPCEPDLPPVVADAPAELLSTSGTTGLPRLVQADHGNLARDYDVEPSLDLEPYYFVHALTLGTNVAQVALRSSLTLGYAIVALETFDLQPYIDLARKLPMRGTLLVPAMATSFGAEADQRGWTLPEVEVVAVSGAATPPATWRRLAAACPNAQLINTYTTTEAWPARATMVVDPERITSVGRPLDGQAVEVRDEAGRPVAPFERGTICLAHRGVKSRRYLDRNQDISAIFEGWVETDDLGYLDDAGFLYVEDRKSDVIVSGGNTISTLEVERALAEHPEVVEAAAFGLSHHVLGEYVAACVVGPSDLDLDDVERVARAQLAEHKVPRLLRRISALPRTRSGKVAKRVLRDDLGGTNDTRADHAGGAEAKSSSEARIQKIWEQVLERPGLGVEERFLAIGGDSLAALRVVARIRAELTEDVPAARLMAAPTIVEQAALVSAVLKEQ